MENKQIFLIASYKASQSLVDFYNEIKSKALKLGDTFVLFNQKNDIVPDIVKELECHVFRDNILTMLGYIPITDTLVPGSNHFSLLDFFQKNPGYDYYWYIEDDVRFTGDWQYFIDSFTNLPYDFISCKIRKQADDPQWFWWNFISHTNTFSAIEERIGSFNPIYRISHAALSFIHKALIDGWFGHHEVLIPTLLYNHGYTMIDFGGTGEFSFPHLKEKFYTPDTMRWRPVFASAGERENTLYHPVKNVLVSCPELS